MKKDNKIVQTKPMKNFDEDAFLAGVPGSCWAQALNETDAVHIPVAQCSSLFSAFIDKHAPLTSIQGTAHG